MIYYTGVLAPWTFISWIHERQNVHGACSWIQELPFGQLASWHRRSGACQLSCSWIQELQSSSPPGLLMMVYYTGVLAPWTFIFYNACQLSCAWIQELQLLHGYLYLHGEYHERTSGDEVGGQQRENDDHIAQNNKAPEEVGGTKPKSNEEEYGTFGGPSVPTADPTVDLEPPSGEASNPAPEDTFASPDGGSRAPRTSGVPSDENLMNTPARQEEVDSSDDFFATTNTPAELFKLHFLLCLSLTLIAFVLLAWVGNPSKRPSSWQPPAAENLPLTWRVAWYNY